MLPPGLDSAFRATTYRAWIEGRAVDVRIGRVHPALDELIGHRSWAVLTAWNPFSQAAGEAANAAAQQQLDRVIDGAGAERFRALGVADDGRWSEESRLVIVDRALALRWGRDFGQWAIVTGVPGGEARLEPTGAAPPPA